MATKNYNFNVRSDIKSAKDYFFIIRNNLKYLIIISSVIIILSVVYAELAKDVYVSTVTIKLIQQNQNILENTPHYNPNPDYLDRFISNEIGIITNFNTREKTAQALIDSFNTIKNPNLFEVIRAKDDPGINNHKTLEVLTNHLAGTIGVGQNPGSDVIEISAESRSAFEAALIANTWAHEYQEVNLEINRAKLTTIRKFLEQQSQKKLAELRNAEDSLKKFQEQGGIVSLDVQSSDLLNQLSQLDAQKEATKIDLMTSNEILKQYKYFLNNQDPHLVQYLENQSSQAYITALQQQLAELQVNRDLAISIKNPNVDISNKIKEYDQRIDDLKGKLNSAISNIKSGGFSGNPEQVTQLAQRLIEEEVKNNSLSVRLQQLESTINEYEQDVKRLPSTSTKLAQYQRQRESLQQLYLLINDKYQEATINELSQEGNVVIIGEGKIPDTPAKPKRKIIIFFGIILGAVVGVSFILIKDYFNDTIKSPEDIEKKHIPLLAWIPHSKTGERNNDVKSEFVTLYDVDSPISEAFKTLRARVQYSKLESNQAQIILVTSPAEHEGKTFVSINLAASFALSNKKTLLIDGDLRRPRIHTILGNSKTPGLTDYVINDVAIQDVVRDIKPIYFSYISSGSISSNPIQILESEKMQNFLQEIRHLFEVIIIDSAPIVALIDTEILTKRVDGTILVVSSDKTETRVMKEALEILENNNSSFLGTVLNNFSDKSGHGYYYKYHYNYRESSNRKKKLFS